MTQSLPKPPASFDWRPTGYVSPVSDDRPDSSMAAEAVVSSAEGGLAMKTGSLTLLSREQMIDCIPTEDAQADTVYAYLKQSGGLETDADYKLGPKGSCRFNATKIKAKYNGFRTLKSDEELLKANVAANGQFVVSLGPDLGFPFYAGGIYNSTECNPLYGNALVVVGYGTENGTDFWSLKNSWGIGWGERGYIRIVRGINRCGLADHITQPIVSAN